MNRWVQLLTWVYTRIRSATPFRYIGSSVNGIPELEDEELLHGTGIGKSLYKSLTEAQVATTMIIMFALEGGKNEITDLKKVTEKKITIVYGWMMIIIGPLYFYLR